MLAATIFIALATIVSAVIACLQLRVYRQQLRVYEQQGRLAERSLRLSLYEKRSKVFRSFMEFLAAAVSKGNVDNSDLSHLLRETSEVDFLFPPDIKEYLREAYRKGLDLHAGELKLDGPQFPAGSPERERLVKSDRELLDWFEADIKVATGKFLPYLDFKDV